MDAKSLGNTIKKYRKQHKITQNDLAQSLNVTDKAVCRWESGLGFPEITQLVPIAETFGITVDKLLKSSRNGIAIAGTMIVDTINLIDEYPEKGMLVNISSSSRAVGGCVCNTIIDLAKIDSDLNLSAIGKIGDDDNGKFIVSEMKKYGIDTSKTVVTKDFNTSCDNVMSVVNGERTFFLEIGANTAFDESDIDIDNLDCDIFHIGYVALMDTMDSEDKEYGTRLARLLKKLTDRGIRTSIDCTSSKSERFCEIVKCALKYCNYSIMNEIETGMTTGIEVRNSDGSLNIKMLRCAMEKYIEYGVKEKVIVHCREGGFMLTSNGEFISVASLELPKGYIKGNTGAGDAFAAGCLYGIYNNFDNNKILEFATATAAMNLSEADSVSGVKNYFEIEKFMNNTKRGEIELC